MTVEDANDAIRVALEYLSGQGIVVFGREIVSVKRDENKDWKVKIESPKYSGVITVYSSTRLIVDGKKNWNKNVKYTENKNTRGGSTTVENANDAIGVALEYLSDQGIVVFGREIVSVKRDENKDWKVKIESPKYSGVITVYSSTRLVQK